MQCLPVRLAAVALVAGFSTWALGQEPAVEAVSPLPAGSEELTDPSAVEYLNRGPIHEAFADRIPDDPAPTEAIPQEPPEPIEEIPPEVKPDDDAVWIPGYFAWSDTESDFIWISGVWRVPPPGQRWTPGYWAEASGGYQWVPGFWVDAQAQDLDYLPYPPESLETGPASPAPSDDHYWVAGSWVWQSGSYAWRPGYWTVYRSGWVWIPHHYAWSPRGAVYCGGYWDYPFARRGMLFSPVHYHRPIYRQPGYSYTPRYAINPASLLLHLFVHRGHRHLYFGDYYGSNYYDRGWRSWGHSNRHHNHLPSFVYYRHHFRHQGVDFHDRLNRWSQYYNRHPDYRPAHTIGAALRQAERYRDNRSFSGASLFAIAVNELLDRDDDRGRNYRRLSDADRVRIARDRSEISDFRRRRAQFEARTEAISRADRNGRVDGDRDRGSRPSLELPNYLNDDDRRERMERQLRELRRRIPDGNRNADRGDDDDRTRRPDRGDRDRTERPDRGDADRGDRDRPRIPDRGDATPGDATPGDDDGRTERPDRGDADRGDRDRPRIPGRGDATPGDATPGDATPGDDDGRTERPDRGDADRGDRDRPRIPDRGDATPGDRGDRVPGADGGRERPSRPVTPPGVGRGDERPNSLEELRDRLRNRSGSDRPGDRTPSRPSVRPERPSGDSNRVTPSERPSTSRPTVRPERPSVRPERPTVRPERPSRDSEIRDARPRSSNRELPTARPSASRPSPERRVITPPSRTNRPSATAPSRSSNRPSARPSRSQPRATAPQPSRRPSVTPQRSSRPSVGPSRSSRPSVGPSQRSSPPSARGSSGRSSRPSARGSSGRSSRGPADRGRGSSNRSRGGGRDR